MLLPLIGTETYRFRFAIRFWYEAAEPIMRPVSIEILLKISKLRLKIGSCPEKRVVQTLSPNRTDQPFDKRMREQLDFGPL
jgi:hypothetical protein